MSEKNLTYDNSENTKPTKCVVKGKIPRWLKGDFIRNGPGEVDIGNESFSHWFDGHAMINKFSVKEGQAFYSSKFIESMIYKTNHKHNRIICSTFGVSIPDPCKNIFSRFFTKYFSAPINDNTNVNVAKLGDTFYAITDSDCLYEFDRETLQNKKEPYSVTKACGSALATAHPHYDTNGDYYNIGARFGKQSVYTVLKVDFKDMVGPNPMQHLKEIAEIPADDTWNPSYFHSFALTKNYVVIHEQNFRISIKKILTPGYLWGGLKDLFTEDENKKSVFHVVSKESGKQHLLKFVTENRICYHHVNAFEDKVDGYDVIVMDMMCSKKSWLSDIDLHSIRTRVLEQKFQEPDTRVTAHRYILPLNIDDKTPQSVNLINFPGFSSTAVLQEDGTIYLEADLLVPDKYTSTVPTTELPRINYNFNGRKYRYIYANGSSIEMMSSVVKFDIHTRELKIWKEQDHTASEPVFVPQPDATEEDDGVVISVVISNILEKSAFLLVLDAKTFTEIARARVNAKPTAGIHGMFVN